ncbi:acyl carrier protein 2 [Artemisia annua]|uniref:Acyl carrier protein 2 n=1 Tax=Artemisia annua TaxID=35608 RepID=A0A2U1P791_ARTAN|nr:acyl carrier protein 2 [Artemisia annua]
MASFIGSSASTNLALPQQSLKASTRISGPKVVSFSNLGRSNLPVSFRRLQVSCAAKPETVDKVCGIVRKQLALKDDISVTGESKFASLGADSLDTVLQSSLETFISGLFLSNT